MELWSYNECFSDILTSHNNSTPIGCNKYTSKYLLTIKLKSWREKKKVERGGRREKKRKPRSRNIRNYRNYRKGREKRRKDKLGSPVILWRRDPHWWCPSFNWVHVSPSSTLPYTPYTLLIIPAMNIYISFKITL